jgi:hypothetical protein
VTTRRARRRERWSYNALRRCIRFRLVIPVFRSPHPPEHTARGVANGVFWALTPLVGLQTVCMVTTWWVGRKLFRKDSSLLQAFIWAWVNNPVTMIPMYYAFYRAGLWMTAETGVATGYDAFSGLWNANTEMGWSDRVAALARAIGLPILVGSVPFAISAAALSYWWAVTALRRRAKKLSRL